MASEKHGHNTRSGGQSPTYRSWGAAVRRCRNLNTVDWPAYGGRGVQIAERWVGPEGFANFLADMGERPDGRTLDRIDNDGDYEPSNCRWATATEQAGTRRKRGPFAHNPRDPGTGRFVAKATS